NSIIAASAALVEEVVAVEEAGRALASAAPVRSYSAANLRGSGPIRGSSPSRPQRAPHVARTEAEGQHEHDQAEDDGVTCDDPHERENAYGWHDDEQQPERSEERRVGKECRCRRPAEP